MKIIWRSLKNGKRNVIKIKNNYIEIFQGAKFATWSWCGSQRTAPSPLYPFVGWTPRVKLIFIFKWSKRPLDSGGGRCDHHHFYLSEQCFGTISKKYRHCSEQYQRKTDIIPKLFDIVPKRLFTLFALFWTVILIFNRKKLSKFAENSLNSPKIRFAYYEKRIFKLSKR